MHNKRRNQSLKRAYHQTLFFSASTPTLQPKKPRKRNCFNDEISPPPNKKQIKKKKPSGDKNLFEPHNGSGCESCHFYLGFFDDLWRRAILFFYPSFQVVFGLPFFFISFFFFFPQQFYRSVLQLTQTLPRL